MTMQQIIVKALTFSVQVCSFLFYIWLVSLRYSFVLWSFREILIFAIFIAHSVVCILLILLIVVDHFCHIAHYRQYACIKYLSFLMFSYMLIFENVEKFSENCPRLSCLIRLWICAVWFSLPNTIFYPMCIYSFALSSF